MYIAKKHCIINDEIDSVMRVFFPLLTAMTRYNSVECASVELVRAEGAAQSGGHLRMRRANQPPLTNTITQEEGSRVDRRGEV